MALSPNTALEHGGRLREAARRYGIPLARWIDLSTGINPHAYPVPAPPPDVWRRLPEDDDGLEEAARRYYADAPLLPVAGTQAALRLLPELLPGQRVTLATPTYGEHLAAWRPRAPRQQPVATLEHRVDDSDIVVVCNPNNPCGTRFARSRLLDWLRRLRARNGWLVVDEAFIDTEPHDSLVTHAGQPGLVILRSPGKFFGLAGARAGFVFAPPDMLAALAQRLGPWSVSGPARHAVRAALDDRAWQTAMRSRLAAQAARLAALLTAHGFSPHGTTLFKYVATPRARALADALARHGILVRAFDHPSALRFGLPGDETEWSRLATALTHSPGHDSR